MMVIDDVDICIQKLGVTVCHPWEICVGGGGGGGEIQGQS